jgi:UDP-N-acetylmuramoyl-tripeptide--D-alanyl-D-alanine ligase
MNPGIKFSELASLEHDASFSTDFEITRLCTDTRTINPGDSYLAIKGEKFDGHDFIGEALARGAAALVVSNNIDVDVPSIKVNDTVVSLGNIAKIYRNKLPAKVVGITGSNGKTTVKGMLGSVCAEFGEVTVTAANNNNMIGVPQTLLSANKTDRFLIVEMGTSESGEIAYLSNIVEPDVSIIINISESHLSGIGTKEDVFIEKSEITRATRNSGSVVINLDDEYAGRIADLSKTNSIITYGFDGRADVSGEFKTISEGTEVSVRSPAGDFSYRLRVPGRHNVSNSFAVVAIASTLGIGADSIISGLQAYSGVDGRLQAVTLRKNIILLNDAYNANPASSCAAIDVASGYPGRKVFVFAGMAELGDSETALHEAIGSKATESGIDVLFTLGEISRPTFEMFGGQKYHFDSFIELEQALLEFIQPDDVVLVKGSRRYKMDRLCRRLEEEAG